MVIVDKLFLPLPRTLALLIPPKLLLNEPRLNRWVLMLQLHVSTVL